MGGIWKPAGRKKYRIWYKDHNGRRQTAPGFRDKEASLARLRDLERDEERREAGLPVTDRTGTSQISSLTGILPIWRVAGPQKAITRPTGVVWCAWPFARAGRSWAS